MLHFVGIYNYTVILTYLSLVSAVGGILLASRGQFTAAVVCLLLSGFCDAFDGIVARSKKDRTREEKAFGIQIDSLCDAVSFGLFPGLLCFFLGMQGPVGIAILVAYCLCAVIRLAYFNVLEEQRQQTEGGCNKFYRGLPVTSISIVLPLFYPVRSLWEPAFPVLLHLLMGACAFLFVLDFRVKKPDWTRLLRRKS